MAHKSTMLLQIIIFVLTSDAFARQITPPSTPPLGWRRATQPITKQQEVSLIISLAETNQHQLETIALEVSTPSHSNYGKYLEATDIDQLTAPTNKTLASVLAWLAVHNLAPESIVRERTLRVVGSVKAVESLLATSFEIWVHPSHTASPLLRATTYTVPDSLHGTSIAAIFGLHSVPYPEKNKSKRQALNQRFTKSFEKLTPAVLQEAYRIPTTTKDTVDATRASGVKQAVVEFGVESASPVDVSNFFKHYVPPGSYQSGKDDTFDIIGTGAGGRPEVESNLDIQYIMAMAPGAATEFWYLKTNDLCSSFKDLLDLVLSRASMSNVTIPSVFSISYGIQGNITGLGCTPEQVTTTDADFAKVAALGVTMVVASGDSGAMVDAGSCNGGPVRNSTSLQGTTSSEHQLIDSYLTCCTLAGASQWTFVGPEFGTGSGVCKVFDKVTGSTPDTGSGTVSSTAHPNTKVWTSYPSSSPWVTATGATRLIDIDSQKGMQNVHGGEMSSVSFGSGGGFSFDFSVPKWQLDSIKHYMNESLTLFPTFLPPIGSYPLNGMGRGNPDVSALGENFVISNGYGLFNVSGTSGTAPFFAGLVTLLNAERKMKKKPALGFLNPWLYSNPQMFTDITQGTNAISRGGTPTTSGWNASVAWDPATGLGSPLFDKMVDAALNL